MKPHHALRCLGAVLLTTANAELVQDVPVIELKPKPDEVSLTTTFEFHNNGTRPVKVVSIDSACSCLSATLDKTLYQPGEKGTGKVAFRISNLTGHQEKSLCVHTDDPARPDCVIRFAIDIPEVIRIEPKTLQWSQGDPPTAKTARVTMMGAQPMKITMITSTNERVEFSWQEITASKEYEITVKPVTTTEIIFGALKVETDSKIPKYLRQLVYFAVCRKPGAGPVKP